ncbi:MAG: YciI family protein [Spirosomataceae bacterium]
MQQYVIIAHDGTDENALERRMNIRPFHLDGAKKLKENGNFVVGGAMLDDNGKMIGSVMIVQFETEADLRQWEATEPYIVDGVWVKYEIKPFRVANV